MPAFFRLSKILLAVAVFGGAPLSAIAADWSRADIDKAASLIAAASPYETGCLANLGTGLSHDVQQIDVNKDGTNELVVYSSPALSGSAGSQAAQAKCMMYKIISIMVSDGKGGWINNISFTSPGFHFRDRPDDAWPDVEMTGRSPTCSAVYRYYKDKYRLWKTCDNGGNRIFAGIVDGVPRDFGIDTFPPTPYPAANVEGIEFVHNGSTMYVNPSLGVISYKLPKRSIARTVSEGDVVFQAAPWNPDDANLELQGTAYTFKKGCAPAPYHVTGRYDRNGTLILRGWAPIRDKRSCAVNDYSPSSGNAELVFTSTTPSLASWQGYFAGDCARGNRIQCTIEVEVRGKALWVQLDISNRYSSKDVKCRLTGMFEPRGSELRGGFDKAPNARFVQVDGGLRLAGLPKAVCGETLNGDYHAFGD